MSTALAYRRKLVPARDAARPEAGYVLGRLYLEGAITAREHRAGFEFSRLIHDYMTSQGYPSPFPQSMESVRRTGCPWVRNSTPTSCAGRQTSTCGSRPFLLTSARRPDPRCGRWPRREIRSATIENPAVPVSAENFLALFGVQGANLPAVTIDTALTVPAVLAAVAFLSRTLAALPLHAYRRTRSGPQRVAGKLGEVVHESANAEMDAFEFRQWFWQQVFTGGRGLAWIERTPQGVEALWPMDPKRVVVRREGFRRVYRFDSRDYASGDVIDVAFMLRSDQLGHYGPIALASKAIQLALAMNDYGSQFFAGGGVPPLALTGPLPQGAEAMKRAMADVHRAIDAAKASAKPVFPLPPGHELKPVGFDPEKGQMTEARRFQVEEIARAFQLPPVFLQDLSRATFTNAEQQDLHLVKHLIGQWAKALESEMNLKLFGRMNGGRYVEHNLDGLMRGDFKSRLEGLARAIQTSQITPNEARAIENRPDHPNPAANDLLIQGATVPLGTSVAAAAPPAGRQDGAVNGQEDDPRG